MFFRKLSRKQRAYLNLILGAVLVVLIPLGLASLRRPSTAQASWFDDAWNYRQVVTLTVGSSSSDISNLETFVIVNTSAISTKLQSSCQDLRFTSQTGKLLPYYIDSGCGTTSTKIWVMADLVPKNTTTYTMHMYYGNSTASPGSDSTRFRLFNGLVGYWTANETSGTSVVDSSITAGTAGTATGTSIVDGKYAKARSFNGTANNFVQIPDNSSLNPTNQITVAFWAYQAAAQSDKQIIIKNMTSGNGGWRLTATGSNGAFYFQIPVTNFSHGITSGSYSTSAWHHVVGTYDGAKMRLYVDGELANSLDRTGNILSDATTDIYIGRYTSDTAYYNGYVDDARIYNRALSDSEVSQLYNNPGTIATTATATTKPSTSFATEEKAPGPVAYWPLDEGSGVITQNKVITKTNSTTTNLIVNPSFETGLTSWGFAGAGISHAQSSEQAVFGTYSDKVTWSSNAAHYSQYSLSVSASTAYSLTMYVYSSSTNGCFNYWEWNGSSGTAQQTTCPTATNVWQKLTMNVTTRSDTTALLVRFYPGDSTSSGTAYVDGVQVEKASSVTNYCDGSLTGSNASRSWTGTAHASTSICQNTTDATITSGTWKGANDCVVGNCLSFNGTNTVAHNNTSTSVKTVSMWVRPVSVTSTALIDLNGTARITASSGTLSATGFTSPTIYVNGVVSSTITANQWNFVTVTTGTAITASAVKFGNYSTTYFNGFMDEIKFYPDARSAAQVKTDYASRGSLKGTSAALGTSDSQTKTLTNGLTGYWKMDQASWNGTASEVVDSSGNAYHGTAAKSGTPSIPTTAAGKFGNGGSFTATSAGDIQYLTMGNVLDMNSTQSFTVSTWVKRGTQTSSNNYPGIFNKGDTQTASQPYYTMYIPTDGANTNKAFFIITDGTNGASLGESTRRDDSAWHHYVGIVNRTSASMSLYVDGVLQSNTSIASVGSLSNAKSLLVASREDSSGAGRNGLTGSVDEFRIYNRALTPAEVTSLYNFSPEPVGYWNFNENTGSSAYDKSGNSNTGTITGAAWKPGKYGPGLEFDGSDDVVTVTNASTIDLNTYLTGHTYEAWINADSDGEGDTGQVYQKGTTTYVRVSGQSGTSLNIDASLDLATTDATVSISAPITTGTWNHVAVVYEDDSDDEISVYVNGVLKGTSTNGVGSPAAESSNLLIGGTTTANFDGKIDDFRFYGYGITTKQIVSDMNAGHPAVGSPVGSAIGHWKFDQGVDNICSGGTNDACNSGSQGSTLDGSNSGLASPATSTSGWTNSGKFGKALIFDGSNDYVNISNTGGAVSSGDLSVSGWIYPTTIPTGANDAVIADLAGSSTTERIYVAIQTGANSGKLTCNGYDGTVRGIYNTGPTLTANTWYHFACVVDSSGNYTLYLNGVSKATSSSTNVSATSPTMAIGSLSSGAGGPGRYFTGTIDEIKIYNYALTADEVKIDMNRGSSQVLGSLSDKSTPGSNFAAGQEYCPPGDSASCAGPVGEWRLDEGLGTAPKDTSGNAFNGSFNGSPTWSTGKIGKGLRFSGARGNSVVVTDNSTLSFTGNNMSISVWVKPSTVSGTRFAAGKYKCGVTWREYGIGLSGANALFSVGNNSGTTVDATGVTTLSAEKWYHLEGTYDGSNARVYVNGVLDKTQSGSVSMFDGTGDFTIGSLQSDPASVPCGSQSTISETNGTVDHVRVYNYVRSASQIAWDYNKGAPVGHWKFDECQGTTAYDDSRSGNGTSNGNNGTITPGGAPNTAVGTCGGSAATMWADGASGKYNSSLDFDGTDDYVTVTDPSSGILDFGTGDFTLSAWINAANANQYGPVITKRVASGGFEQYNFGVGSINSGGSTVSGKTIYFFIRGSSTNQSYHTTNNIVDGNWHHIVGVRKSGVLSIYVDGVNQALTADSAGTTALNADNSAPLQIGAENGSNFFTGLIDNPSVFNYALTATQVKTLYGSGAVRFGPVTGTP